MSIKEEILEDDHFILQPGSNEINNDQVFEGQLLNPCLISSIGGDDQDFCYFFPNYVQFNGDRAEKQESLFPVENDYSEGINETNYESISSQFQIKHEFQKEEINLNISQNINSTSNGYSIQANSSTYSDITNSYYNGEYNMLPENNNYNINPNDFSQHQYIQSIPYSYCSFNHDLNQIANYQNRSQNFQIYSDESSTHHLMNEQALVNDGHQFYKNVSYFVTEPSYENQSLPNEQWNNGGDEGILNKMDVSNDDNEPIVNQFDTNNNKENVMSIDEIQKINSKYLHQRFPIKLWNLASDESFKPIKWSTDGMSLIIDEYNLEPNLGYFFRSKKFSSFLRQLHLYGFRKVTRARNHRSSSTRMDDTKCREEYFSEYQCSYFQRDKFELVKNVRRFYGHNQSLSQKTVSSVSSNSSSMSSSEMNATLSQPISMSIEQSQDDQSMMNDYDYIPQMEQGHLIEITDYQEEFQLQVEGYSFQNHSAEFKYDVQDDRRSQIQSTKSNSLENYHIFQECDNINY